MLQVESNERGPQDRMKLVNRSHFVAELVSESHASRLIPVFPEVSVVLPGSIVSLA